MTATVVLVTLLLAPAAAGSQAAAAACETFTRSTATLPPLVREWFAHSPDERVLVCPQPAPPGSQEAALLYVGEGAVTQHGAVCSYLSHGLTLAGSGAAAHLQRYEPSEALAMALAGAGCPQRGTGPGTRYVETYDVTPAAFIAIMRLWPATSTAPALPANGTGCCSSHAGPPAAAASTLPAAATADPGASRGARAAETRARLEAAIGPSRLSGAAVMRIVRIPGSVLRHRYALFVRVPDAAAGAASLYVIYVEKGLRGPYEITSFAETN